jgi:hypothetical protein
MTLSGFTLQITIVRFDVPKRSNTVEETMSDSFQRIWGGSSRNAAIKKSSFRKTHDHPDSEIALDNYGNLPLVDFFIL